LALTAVQQQQVIETVRAFLRHRGSNRYQGQHYAFSSQGSEVRVVATDGRGEILQASAERIQSSLLREDWERFERARVLLEQQQWQREAVNHKQEIELGD
jgi:hypothetical protein